MIILKITNVLLEHDLTTKQVAKHQHIPYTTLKSTFDRPLDKWTVGTLRAVAEELNMGVENLITLLDISDPLEPFIKWVGGKRQLLGEINRRLPPTFNRYFEPFLGGGAVFLSLVPEHATINDFNAELVNVWKTVQTSPNDLLDKLKVHEQQNSKEYYLDLRQTDRDGRIEKMSPVDRAARFIYMNKTGFNGLWRVNKLGQNNVPYGRYVNPKICDDRILPVSDYLNKNDVTILNGDYRAAVADAQEHDFVYFDPPYIPVTPTASFTAYTNDAFGLKQQEELRDTFVELTQRNVYVMLSNADVPLIDELYGKIPHINIHKVSATRNINSDSSKRGKVGEVLITNY